MDLNIVPTSASLHPLIEKHKPKNDSFRSFSLHSDIIKAIESEGYTEPTPIQYKAIPPTLAGFDLLASAQTGTGKTAAFMLPAVHRIATSSSSVQRSKGPRVLILTPTRELALQVEQSARTYSKFLRNIKAISIIGGMSYYHQRQHMKGVVDIMVATPGRLMDYMEQGEIDFSQVELLILDEADRMLDMGFKNAVTEIVKELPKKRQTLLYSATMDDAVVKLSRGLLNNPKRIEITPPKSTHTNIKQKIHLVLDQKMKMGLVRAIIDDKTLDQAIVFTATKRSADELSNSLYRNGIEADALHGDIRQNIRIKIINRFKNRSIKILVATDVAARGIDIPGIGHVINYDLPRAHEDYIHRIGRTGRAGLNGVAISLVQPSERGFMRKLEQVTGQTIPQFTMPGFEVNLKKEDQNQKAKRNRRRW